MAEEPDHGKVALGGQIDGLEKAGLLRRDAEASDRREIISAGENTKLADQILR